MLLWSKSIHLLFSSSNRSLLVDSLGRVVVPCWVVVPREPVMALWFSGLECLIWGRRYLCCFSVSWYYFQLGCRFHQERFLVFRVKFLRQVAREAEEKGRPQGRQERVNGECLRERGQVQTPSSESPRRNGLCWVSEARNKYFDY